MASQSSSQAFPKESLEAMARMIYERYLLTQLEKNPDNLPEYPTWESLPDTLKKSNLRQAGFVFKKLSDCGYTASLPIDGVKEVPGFTQKQLELLSRKEHDDWVAERLADGWRLAPYKDALRKLTPYLIPYEMLPEEIRELDRNAVRNVFPLVHSLGLKVYKTACINEGELRK